MKKRTLVCFLIFTLCVLYTSIPNTVFGQEVSLAEQVAAKYSETLQREDVREILPGILIGLKDSDIEDIPGIITLAITLINAGQEQILQAQAQAQGVTLTDDHIALLKDPDVQVLLSDEDVKTLLQDPAEIDKLANLLGVPPVVQPPVVQPPVVQPPVVQPPVVQPPVVQPPVVQPPVVQPPVVQPPVVQPSMPVPPADPFAPIMPEDPVLPWNFFSDSSRVAYDYDGFDGLDDAEFVDRVANFYRRNYWSTSGVYAQLWVESRSLTPTLAGTARELGVSLYPSGGMASDTFVYGAAAEAVHTGREHMVVMYVGDYDPAGLQIANSLETKLGEHLGYAAEDYGMDMRLSLHSSVWPSRSNRSSTTPYLPSQSRPHSPGRSTTSPRLLRLRPCDQRR